MRKLVVNLIIGIVLLLAVSLFLFESRLEDFFAKMKAFSITEVDLYTLAGDRFRIPEGARGYILLYADLKGCNACLDKIGELKKLAQIYDDVAFFAVLKGDEQIESFIQFMNDQGMPGEYLMDPTLNLYYRLGISNHPMLLFFNRDGLLMGAIPYDVNQGNLRKTYHQYIDEM